ncbi:hypothetical protein BDQ94DRAFT_186477 [Aspergillus welwitschiae]|uniref:YhhN-like protein n=1 Tax=Aspergillus welwitschiae TaxID=1341132 RepID=A0A3F3PI81_9EURO|nr:hypothetical protein BDQ94DRAFT_186477 [Aspergillus welwitschiae]RDH26639.1 hypothetical protein BDQ94DRAFT_186477 [Aspergillus welwitschiae]
MVTIRIRGSDLLIITLRIFTLIYLTFFSANYFYNFITLPLDQVQNAFPDALVLLSFFIAASILSVLSIQARLNHGTVHLEQAAVITFLAIADASFIYIQFHHDKWIILFYASILLIMATQCLSHCLNIQDGIFFNFASICLTHGILTLIPAIHASLWSSACRQSMLASYLIFMALNATGCLSFLFQIPDRFGFAGSSKLVLHLCTAMGTVYLFNALLDAVNAGNGTELDGCRRSFW